MIKVFTYGLFAIFLFLCSNIVYVQSVADAEQRSKGVVAIATLEGSTGGSNPEDDVEVDYNNYELPNY